MSGATVHQAPKVQSLSFWFYRQIETEAPIEFDLLRFLTGAKVASKGPFQFFNAQAGYGADLVELELFTLDVGAELFELVWVGAIDFGGAHDHQFASQGMVDDGLGVIFHGTGHAGGAEAGQLVVDDFEVFDGVEAAAGVADVDQVEEDAGALDVAEELGAETGAKVGALDESGHVGDDVGLLIGLFADGDDAEVGLEGGEGVVGDFGFGGGDAGDECGLAGVRVAYEADVGEEFQFETIGALFAGAAHFVFAGGLVDGGGEVLVATTAASALGDDDAFVGLGEVVNELAGFLVVQSGTDGDLEGDGFSIESGAVGSEAVLATLGLVLGVIAEMDEGVVALRGDHDDVAAASAVAAGGTAAGNELFAAEGHAAIAAVAGFYLDFCFIDEHKYPGVRFQGSGVRD